LGVLLVLSKSLQQVKFNRVYFIIFRAKLWKILIFESILLLEIQNKLQKLVLNGKIQSSPQCVHTAKFRHFSILKMWKIKNVFTLGPMAQATPVELPTTE
jgi:hypothetical protein